jgi:hypothetical protein
MFEKLKNLFKKQEDTPIARKELPKPTPKQVKAKTELTEKEKATAAGDFNDKFVLNLIKAGYRQREDDTDVIIVDRWFQTVCRNVALEMYEQQVADPENRTESRDARVIRTKDLGNGRTEVS